ncbi:hypothetical protein G3N57_34025, partial [Paraburkholderia sp. Se-20369]|nr:hypothetical protein [Paraburkholderia sp. Se-20369]
MRRFRHRRPRYEAERPMKPGASFLVSIAAAAGTFYAACLPAATQTSPGPAPAAVPTPASALAATAPADAAGGPSWRPGRRLFQSAPRPVRTVDPPDTPPVVQRDSTGPANHLHA